jgi:predicted O-linked N-acetylglucosamine transferase (SPINDLY family)
MLLYLHRALGYGLTDCVAGSQEEYIQTAVNIASDQDRRRWLSDEIRHKSNAIFEDKAVVEQFAAFFESSVQRARA